MSKAKIVRLWDTSPARSKIVDTDHQYAHDNLWHLPVLGQGFHPLFCYFNSWEKTTNNTTNQETTPKSPPNDDWKHLSSAKLKMYYCKGQVLDLCRRPRYYFKYFQYKLALGKEFVHYVYILFSTLAWSFPMKNLHEGTFCSTAKLKNGSCLLSCRNEDVMPYGWEFCSHNNSNKISLTNPGKV